jgi:hypothetical protein
MLAFFACRARPPTPDDGGTVALTPGMTPGERTGGGLEAVLPVRAAEGSQPRWRYLAHGPAPRGRVRWRIDLTPRQGSGEPASDGRTLYLTATRIEPEENSDGLVYAVDLFDGTVRWRTPVEGLHGAPVELIDGVVLLDTIPHCVRRAAATPGVPTRPCVESAPGGIVGLDAVTGRVRFRAPASSDTLHARWTATTAGPRTYVHDGPYALRPLTLPTGALGPRVLARGTVLHATALGTDLLFTSASPTGVTRLVRVAHGAIRPVWERELPLRTHCPPLVVGSLVILPAFQSSTVTGAVRALRARDASDAWTAPSVPRSVGTCAMVEGSLVHQVIDGALERIGIGDGHLRGRVPIGFDPSSDFSVLLDGVLYLGARGRLVGLRVNDGAPVLELETSAEGVEGVVLWGGHGGMLTRSPGLVLGFD